MKEKLYTKEEAIEKACLFILLWESRGLIEIKDEEFFKDMKHKFKDYNKIDYK